MESGDGLGGYSKGARAERELFALLTEKGYSVVRSAGSGVNAISPDLVAIKLGRALSIECKAWDRGSLALDNEQFQKLAEWEANTSFPAFVAWRMNGKGWFFIKLAEFTKGSSAYNVTKKAAMQLNRKLEDVS